jgi:hypothetical protein
MFPWTVANTVFVAGNVDRIAASARTRDVVMRMFVRDHDVPVGLFRDPLGRLAETCSRVRLARVNRIAKREPSSSRPEHAFSAARFRVAM